MPNKTTTKVAYDMDLGAKYKLSVLKAELRRKGIPATETGVLEVLIENADPGRLATLYRKYLGD